MVVECGVCGDISNDSSEERASLLISTCFLPQVESNPEGGLAALRSLRLRFLLPREIASLMGFPQEFGLPPETTRRQGYKVVCFFYFLKCIYLLFLKSCRYSLRFWYFSFRARICKRLSSPGIDTEESILPACVR
jgi:hypothetical protein